MSSQTSLFEEHSHLTFGNSANHAASILFGFDPADRIVAIETGERETTLWSRNELGVVETVREPFVPWLLTTVPEPSIAVEPRELEGDGFRYLYEFPGWSAYQSVRMSLQDRHVEHFTYPNASRQALIRSGKTLFKGMSISDVVRMQVDLETETLSPDAPDARILIVAVRDNRGLLDTLTGDERDILEQFVALVGERDPDVFEGHNIYGFDLPYLIGRAQKLGVKLALGRDGSEPRVGRQRQFSIGGIAKPFNPVWAYGRHIVDTYLAVQRFDWARGMLTSYGLKEVARAFGIAEEERVEMPRERLGAIYREDPQRVLTYARHDVIETARLAELVTPTEFYMAQMVPDSYGQAAVSGTGEKINMLFIRAYLAAGRAIPRPQRSRAYLGGYTDVRATGLIDRVVKADVESLYPSIMLADKIKPASDTLGIFLPALEELTRRRLEAKSRMRTAKEAERLYWDGLQGSFKILINSFYGYLGAPSFHFNDYEAAGRITERGRELVVSISDRLEATGSRVIEIDTDGVYFVPPESVQDEEAEQAYVAEIGAELPQGIRLAFDGRYRAMVSLKTKNYVLWGYDGKTIFKGASLRSRADEAYGREFLARAIDLLLERHNEDIGKLYRDTVRDLIEGRLPIEKLARRERITEKTFTSTGKARSAEVARDMAVGEYVIVYERKDGSLGLLSEYDSNGRDARTGYYMEKLYKFAVRLREAFGDEFDQIIPTPARLEQELQGQGSLDLFG